MDKENSKKLNHPVKLLAGAVCVIFCIFIFVSFFVTIKARIDRSDSYTIESSFDVTINDETFNDVYLNEFKFPAIVKGDHVVYSFTLPDNQIPNAILSIYLDHSAAKVFFNDELVYKLGSPKSKMLGYGYVNVDLPNDYTGIRVRVEMDTIENEGRTSLTAPVIYNSETYLRNFIAGNCFYLVIDIAIIVLCITIMIISVTFSKIMPALLNITFLSVAFFIMGVWEMCSYNLLHIFTDSLVIRGYIEYLSLYIGPFFLALYFYIDFFINETSRVRTIYRGILIAQGLFPTVAIILHFTDVIHLPAILPVSHALLFISILTVLTLLFKQIKQKNNSHKSMIVGLMIIIVLAISDLGRFNLYKYFFRDKFENYTSYLLVGFLFFFISLIFDFFQNQRASLLKAAKSEAMHKLAHIDIMTGLDNRRSCEELFDEIPLTKEDYVIISIDLNYLKVANDTYGHQEGDRLINEFAEQLKAVCTSEKNTAGRMGGDEFIVIMRDSKASDADALLKELDDNTAKINETRTPAPISYSYGYCTSEESASSIEEAYRIADERMYEHKKRIKAQRV